MQQKYRILIMGASYGWLLGAKLLLAGHAVKFERVERLVQAVAAQKGVHLAAVDRTAALVGEWLAHNRMRQAVATAK